MSTFGSRLDFTLAHGVNHESPPAAWHVLLLRLWMPYAVRVEPDSPYQPPPLSPPHASMPSMRAMPRTAGSLIEPRTPHRVGPLRSGVFAERQTVSPTVMWVTRSAAASTRTVPPNATSR